MTIVFHAEALEEMVGAAAYYEDRSPGLGTVFLDAMEQTTRRITARPEAGPIERGDVRKRFVAGFPFKVLYSIEPERIFVLAVMHQRRRPGYWRGRRSA
jgi:toxin ParE1/3/4